MERSSALRSVERVIIVYRYSTVKYSGNFLLVKHKEKQWHVPLDQQNSLETAQCRLPSLTWYHLFHCVIIICVFIVLQWGWLVSALEWCVFVCNHSARGDQWKNSFATSPPFAQAIMANGNKPVFVANLMLWFAQLGSRPLLCLVIGFRTPLGTWVVSGLHCLPLWLYACQWGLLAPWVQAVGSLLLVSGRLLALSAEVEIICNKHQRVDKMHADRTPCAFLCRSGVCGPTLSTWPTTRGQRKKRTERHSAKSAPSRPPPVYPGTMWLHHLSVGSGLRVIFGLHQREKKAYVLLLQEKGVGQTWAIIMDVSGLSDLNTLSGFFFFLKMDSTSSHLRSGFRLNQWKWMNLQMSCWETRCSLMSLLSLRHRRGIQKSVLNRTPGHQRDHSSRAQLFFCIVRIIVFDCKGLLLLDSGLESLVTCEYMQRYSITIKTLTWKGYWLSLNAFLKWMYTFAFVYEGFFFFSNATLYKSLYNKVTE